MNIGTEATPIATTLKPRSNDTLCNIKKCWDDSFLKSPISPNIEIEGNNDNNMSMLKTISAEDPLNLKLDTFESICQRATDITRTIQHYHMDELIRPPSIEHLASSFQSASTITDFFYENDDDDIIIKEGDLEMDLEEQEHELFNWREAFLEVISSLVSYSEELESLSTELLRTKNKVREFVLLQKSLLEKYEQQEKIYKNRLLECERVSQQQNILFDHLIELNYELLEPSSSDKSHHLSSVSKRPITTSSSTLYNWPNKDCRQLPNHCCWSENSTISYPLTSPLSLMKHQHYYQAHQKKNTNSNNNRLEIMRYKLANWIGGGVGSGRVVHSFEGPFDGMDIIVAGSGALVSPVHSYYPSTPSKIAATDSLNEHLYYFHQSITSASDSSIQHLSFQHHQYMIHITQKNRIDKFQLLPRSLWIPDEQVKSCQFSTRYNSCSILFSFINRRHHCRKCGKVVCQRHSLNRLPLFSNKHSKESWHRVCDECFYNMVISPNS